MYGHMTVICGPMFAGKTTELLKRVLWAQNGQSKRVAVFKSAYDTRYKVTEIVSHDGLQTTASIIGEWPGHTSAEHVFIDEIQFFTEPHFKGDIIAIINSLLLDGIDVTVTGIDLDWRGLPFTQTAMAMAMADEVLKLRSHCAMCGRPATKIYKRNQSGPIIERGGAEAYEPRCNIHWRTPLQNDLFSAPEATPEPTVPPEMLSKKVGS